MSRTIEAVRAGANRVQPLARALGVGRERAEALLQREVASGALVRERAHHLPGKPFVYSEPRSGYPLGWRPGEPA